MYIPASQPERRPCPSHTDRPSERDAYSVDQLRQSSSITGESGRPTTHSNSDPEAYADPEINAGTYSNPKSNGNTHADAVSNSDTYSNPRFNGNTHSNPAIAPCSNTRARADDPAGQGDTLRSH